MESSLPYLCIQMNYWLPKIDKLVKHSISENIKCIILVSMTLSHEMKTMNFKWINYCHRKKETILNKISIFHIKIFSGKMKLWFKWKNFILINKMGQKLCKLRIWQEICQIRKWYIHYKMNYKSIKQKSLVPWITYLVLCCALRLGVLDCWLV